MKYLVVLCFLIVGALAAPEASVIRKIIPVLERTENHSDNGEFTLLYRTGDGTVFVEAGVLKPTHDGIDKVLVKEGEFSFVADDGLTYRTKYIADERGFRAEGEHLPKSVVA